MYLPGQYSAINLHVGDKVSVQIGDEIYTDTLTNIEYEPPAPAVYEQLSWFARRVLRRKPRVVRPASIGTYNFTMGEEQ